MTSGRVTRANASSGGRNSSATFSARSQRHRLGRQLAQHHVQVGDDEERDRDRHAVRHRRRSTGTCRRAERAAGAGAPSAGSPIQPRPRLVSVTPSWVAAITIVAVLDRVAHRGRAEDAALGQLLDARPAHRDQRVLGGHEVRVREHQQQNRENAEGIDHGPRPGRGYSTSRRPSSARASVTRSEYSRSEPIGTPRAMRVTLRPSGDSSRDR